MIGFDKRFKVRITGFGAFVVLLWLIVCMVLPGIFLLTTTLLADKLLPESK